MSWPGFPTSLVLGAEVLLPAPTPSEEGLPTECFSHLTSPPPSHTHTHRASLSPGPLPSCLPYGRAPFSHHRPQTHVCKAQEDAQYTAEAATGTPGGPGLPHVATSATHSPAQPTQVSFTGCRGQRLRPFLSPHPRHPLPPSSLVSREGIPQSGAVCFLTGTFHLARSLPMFSILSFPASTHPSFPIQRGCDLNRLLLQKEFKKEDST